MTEIIRLFVIKLVFPFVIHGGKLIGADRDKTFKMLINLNNRLVIKLINEKKLSRTMLILPHCLQNHDCELKLTSSLFKCKRCGKCDIEKLAELCERYNLSVHLASGGTSAIQTAREVRPQVITAVACERDLISGIRDIYPIPALCITNIRNNVPCRNTRVNCGEVENVFEMLKGMGKGK